MPRTWTTAFRSKSSNSKDDDGSPKSEAGTGSTTRPPSSYISTSPESPSTLLSSHIIPDRREDPIGLTILYAPKTDPTIDIVFVHGLGGSSRATWSWNHDLRTFWPKEWLPTEPGLSSARISTFGYDAHFAERGASSTSTIIDFAKQLLYRLKFHTQAQDSNLGQIPIIFVVHSMGGLVAKQSYILGLVDPQYRDIIDNLCSIVFLATPHRGSDFSVVLNRILSISVFGHHPKRYIDELKRNSVSLQSINEQFRHVFGDIAIVSFFETQETVIGTTKVLIVEKDSAILGYRGEISMSLDADHHSIVKYESREDPSYVTVRDMLLSLAERFRRRKSISASSSSSDVSDELLQALDVHEEWISEDLDLFNDMRAPETCRWLLGISEFQAWVHDQSKAPTVLWVHGPPGVGKSVLSSFIINHLQQHNYVCQYYYFRHVDTRKKRFNRLLRSLAYQLAIHSQGYRHRLLKLSRKGVITSKTGSRVLWQKLFIGILPKVAFSRPIYWVIDSLDSAKSPADILSAFKGLADLKLPLRIIITGRHLELVEQFTRFRESMLLTSISVQNAQANAQDGKQSQTDLFRYVRREMNATSGRWSQDLVNSITSEIVAKADGNFLWVAVVVKNVLRCNTRQEIQDTIGGLPGELRSLYASLQSASESRITNDEDKKLVQSILIWVSCSTQLLTASQLQEAFDPGKKVLDLSWSISNLCGELVVIDSKTNLVSLIHSSALEFLRESSHPWLGVDVYRGHRIMFSRCAKLLMEPQQRLLLSAGKTNGLLDYAARNWSYHLSKSRAFQASNSMRDLLDFFNKGAVQMWIQYLATFSDLKLAVSSARMVTSFLDDKSENDRAENPLRATTDEDRIRQWLTDIVRLVGKFGAELTLYPKLIYRIAAFCPKDSIFRQTFESSSAISITGDEDEWDDYYARFSLDHHSHARIVECSLDHFVVVDSKNRLSAFDALTTIRMHLENGENEVICCRMSVLGSTFVACEVTHTTIWNLYNGEQLFRFANPPRTKVRDVCFTDGESAVLIFCDDDVFRMSLKDKSEWQCVGTPRGIEGSDLSPSIVRLKPDGSLLAMAYEGFPLSVWTTDNLQHIARCSRTVAKPPSPPTHVRRMDWNMANGQIIGIYSSGNVFIWNPQDNKYTLHEMDALEVACSSNGSLFTTSSANGVVQVWNFYTCALIYQVTAAFETSALALSPDGRCVYDIRGPIINIWQPNSLIKWAEEEERDSDSSSSSAPTVREGSLASINGTKIREPVSGLAVHPNGSMFCMGNEAGNIRLAENNGTVLLEAHEEFAINNVVWSPDGAYVAYSTRHFKIAVFDTKSLILAFNITAALPIRQLLFSPDGHKLLVTSNQGFSVYSVQQKSLLYSRIGWDFQQCLNHPLDKDLFLAIRFFDTEIFQWSDLSTIQKRMLDGEEIPTGPVEVKLITPISRILTTADKTSLLLAASCPWRLRDNISDISVIATPSPHDHAPLNITTPTPPPSLLEHLRCTIGFINGSSSDVLVFLDNKSWICTWPLDGGTIKRHFLMPADWLAKEQLNLASVTRDGILHFPRNGRVLIIWNGFEEEWND